MAEQQNAQIDALAGQLVTHQRCLADLSVEDRQWAFQNPKEALALFCDAVENRVLKTLIFLKQTLFGTTPVTVYGLGKRLIIAQMLRALMKLAEDAPLDLVEKLAKDRQHAIPSEDCEVILDKQAKSFRKEKGGRDFGLRGDGWANLILVLNADGSVSVVLASWSVGRWNRIRFSLGRGYVWRRESRLVVSNSVTGNL
jgi:hypothetical protein